MCTYACKDMLLGVSVPIQRRAGEYKIRWGIGTPPEWKVWEPLSHDKLLLIKIRE